MPDISISQLTTKNSLSAANYLPISDALETFKLGTNSLFGYRNRLINGGFSINQRATSTGATNTYTLDRWICANQSANTTITQQTDQANGIPFNIRVGNGATAQKFGVIQYVESANCRDLRGKQVTLSFSVRFNGGTPTIRYGIIEWTGTADTITTPIISNYGTTPPTIATGGTLNSTIFNPTAADTWYNLTLTYTAGSSMNNLAVVIMTNSSSSFNSNRNLDIANVQLEEGSTATPFEFRPISTELSLCQRYYYKTYNLNVVPGTATFVGAAMGVVNSGGYPLMSGLTLKTTMRSSPNVVFYNPNDGQTALPICDDASPVNNTSTYLTTAGQDRIIMYTNSGLSPGNGCYTHFTASAEL